MDELLLALAAVLSFLFGWNNSSFLIGNLRGSGVLTFRATIVISVTGLLAGALLEGPKMESSLVGSLSPATTSAVLLATVSTSILLTLAFTVLDLPVSFSLVMVGAFLGGTVSSGLAVSPAHSEAVIAFWFVAPLMAAAIAFVVYSSAARLVSRFGLLTVDALNRYGSVVSSLAVSYTLGANNLGLIYGSAGVGGLTGLQNEGAVVALTLVAVAGFVTLGRGGVSGTIGDKMLVLSPQGVVSSFMASSIVVWAATQMTIPVSIGQCLLGGMIGAAFTRNVAVLNRKLAIETTSLWLVAPMLAFIVGYFLVLL